MHSSFNLILKRLLPVAFAALALTFVLHAPVLADSAPQGQVCGSVDLNSAGGDAAKAFDCFNDAFAKCAPATLVATSQNAGVATTWTFVTVDGTVDHGCSISETLERGTGSSRTTDAYLCAMVSRDKDGLLFRGCGTQKEVALRVSASTVGASAAANGRINSTAP
jgi:hypothetical protein